MTALIGNAKNKNNKGAVLSKYREGPLGIERYWIMNEHNIVLTALNKRAHIVN